MEDLIRQSKEFSPLWYRDIHLSNKNDKVLKPVCPLEKIIECDENVREGYRNKVEFTVGRKFAGIGEEGPICVGFNKGNMAKGIMYVDEPDDIKVCSKESIIVAKIMKTIITKSGIEPYDRVHNKGFWRIILYRESKKTKECVISVIVTDQNDQENPDVSADKLKELHDTITAHF